MYLPWSSVLTLSTEPVASLVMVTVALGTAAPLVSCTVPRSCALNVAWLHAAGIRQKRRKQAVSAANRCRALISTLAYLGWIARSSRFCQLVVSAPQNCRLASIQYLLISADSR